GHRTALPDAAPGDQAAEKEIHGKRDDQDPAENGEPARGHGSGSSVPAPPATRSLRSTVSSPPRAGGSRLAQPTTKPRMAAASSPAAWGQSRGNARGPGAR